MNNFVRQAWMESYCCARTTIITDQKTTKIDLIKPNRYRATVQTQIHNVENVEPG